jgi:hypothetical protein
MRNVSDRSCRENESTHFMSNKFFFPISMVLEKYGRARQYNMERKRCDLHAKINKARIQTHIYNV